MGTIVERKRKNGIAAYMAQVVFYRGGKVVHREAKTFNRRPVAAAWLKRREGELSKPEALEVALTGSR